MKRLTFLNCAAALAAAMFVTQTNAAPPPIASEYRVGGYVLGRQAYTFHRFTLNHGTKARTV